MFRTVCKSFYSNLRQFDNLEVLNKHLSTNKFAHVLLYFRANWNPNCDLTDKHIIQLASEHRFLEIIKVDTDVCSKITKHYSVKAQPQFIFCLYGDEVIRQIGPNYQGLNDKLSKMVALGSQTSFISSNDKWVPYGSRFEKYYREKLALLYSRNVSDL